MCSPLCLAILTFLFLVRTHADADDGMLPRLAAELMETLDPPDIRFCSSLEMIFWQNMIGAVAAVGTPTRQWFLTSLRRFVPALQLRSWDDTKQVLQRLFCVDY
jgi:hypothetical protein